MQAEADIWAVLPKNTMPEACAWWGGVPVDPFINSQHCCLRHILREQPLRGQPPHQSSLVAEVGALERTLSVSTVNGSLVLGSAMMPMPSWCPHFAGGKGTRSSPGSNGGDFF